MLQFSNQTILVLVSKSVVIVSDIRRKTDVRWFQENFHEKIRLIRIKCEDQVRIDRGWKFEVGVDDIQSECDLDDFSDWSLQLENDGVKDVEALLDIIEGEFLR